METAQSVLLTARVEVLEVVEASIPDRSHLHSKCPSSVAAAPEGHEVLCRAWLGNEVLNDAHLLARLVGVAGAAVSRLVEDREIELAIAGDGVGGGLELALLWEEEGKSAGLVGVPGGDVEVEDGRDGTGGGAVEGVGVLLVGLGLVNGDDEVRELEDGQLGTEDGGQRT